ncbi:COG1361 family protein [Streptomyces violascens]|uniref:hypothetical protein n=1 Tax=Streptomyces violascens TaxID=67381 RepID=UPI0036969EE6
MTIHRRIEVTNTTLSSLQVDLYPGAASIDHGSFVDSPAAARNELTSWITLSRRRLDVPAGFSARATVTVAVPKDAAPGEKYAVIWAQVSSGSGRGGVTLINRTGIRAYLAINGANPPVPNLAVSAVTSERAPDGRGVVRVKVRNSGGRALDLTGNLSLSSLSGNLKAGPYEFETGTTLAPGQSATVKVFVTDRLDDGPWNAALDLRSGLFHKTYQAQVTFPQHPGVAAPVAAHPKTTGKRNLFIGFITGSLTLAMLGVTQMIRMSYRRRSAKEGH